MKILKLIFSLFAISLIIVNCSENEKMENAKNSEPNNLFSKNAKYKNLDYTPSFTNGGRIKYQKLNSTGKTLDFTQQKISEIYNHCTGNTDSENIYNITLYTTGNESDESEIDYTKLEGVSFYKIENSYLKHYFYKKSATGYNLLSDLSLRVPGVSIQNTDFNILYSQIPTFQLSVYFINNNINQNYNSSDEYRNFVSYYFGSQIKLDNPMSSTQIDAMSRRIAIGNGMCGTCRSSVSGQCYELTGACEPSICRFSAIGTTLLDASSPFYANMDEPLTHDIQNNILKNSLFGLKYEMYYYNTSFSNLNLNLNQSVDIARLLPDLYSSYNKILENETEAILVSSEMADKINNILDNLISDNVNNLKYVSILNDIKSDVNYLKNKSLSQINDVLY